MNHTLQRYQPRSEARRLAVAAAVGIAVALAVAAVTPWEATILIGWDVAALVMLAWIWTQVRSLDADATRAVAVHEDDSRTATRLLVVTASVLSLAGVGVALWSGRNQSGRDSLLVAVFGIGTVLLSYLFGVVIVAMTINVVATIIA